MDFTKLRSFNKAYPLFVEKYELFSLGENASVTDKINSVVQALNKVGKLSNDVLKDWNKVMEWAMGEGLNESVDKKVEELIANGLFDELIQLALTDFNEQVDDIVTNIKSFGAKGDGISDDTVALQNAANSGKRVEFTKGTYLCNGVLNFSPNTEFVSNAQATIKTTQNIDLIKLCYKNKVIGINFDLKSVNPFPYTKSLIEISCGTLQGKGVPLYENLQLFVEDIKADFGISPSNTLATMFHIWACKEDPEGNVYEHDGFWGIDVNKVYVKNDIGFFCRNWVYRKNDAGASDGWITTVKFRDVTINTAKYGFFGCRSETEMNNPLFYDASMFMENIIFQASGSSTKRFAFFTGESKVITNSIPYDWGPSADGKPFLIQYRTNGYTEKFMFSGDYGNIEDRVQVNNLPTNIDKINYLKRVIGNYTNIYKGVIDEIKTVNTTISGGEARPIWFNVIDYARDKSLTAFTSSFMANLGYTSKSGKGTALVSLYVEDTDPTNPSAWIKFSGITTPYVDTSDLGEFYVSKELVGNTLRHRVYLKITGVGFGAGGSVVNTGNVDENPYIAPVNFKRLDSQPSESLQSFSDYSVMAFPKHPNSTDTPMSYEGYAYYDTTNKQFKGYNGTSWVVLG